MSNDIEVTVHKVPLLDSGIGQEAGYPNDKEFVEAMAAKRAALPPDVRDACDRIDTELDRRFLYGDG